MDINKCQNCQKQFDQDKRLSKQLPCSCISCLKCLKYVYQFTQKIECTKHQQVFNINPEELQNYVIQEQFLCYIPQYPDYFADQVQINECFRWLQGQYVQKQNYYLMLREVIQDCVQQMKRVQALLAKTILKTLVEQFSISNAKIENLLKRLYEVQDVNEVQKQQDLRLGQQKHH